MAIRLTTTDKPNKATAYRMVRKARAEGCALSTCDLDALINYFAPARSKEPKSAEEWVARACADKNEVRFYLRFLYVSAGVAYGTNGHRLHWCDTKLADGYYSPVTLDPCDCDGTFPDVKRAVPGALSGVEYSTGMEKVAVSGKGDRNVELAKKTYVNEKYWLQALGGDMLATYSVDPGVQCRGRNRFGEFVIMPVRIK
jgi:hypothetical protein